MGDSQCGTTYHLLTGSSMATVRRIAIKTSARILWCAGVAIHQIGSMTHALGRVTLRAAHRLDGTLAKFW